MSAPVFVLLHIPKCAGTTVERHLFRQLGEQGFWSPPKRTRKAPLELLGRKYDPTPPAPAERIRVVSGHFLGRSIEARFAGRERRRAVLLRDPDALQLSYYNYRMMRYLRAGARPYDFLTHLRAGPTDLMASFLLERWFELPLWRVATLGAAARRQMLDSALSAFWFVGDVSDCDTLIASVCETLGVPGNATRENTAEDWMDAVTWTPLTIADLSAQERAELDARTGLDRYLWRRWALGEPASFDPSACLPALRAEIARPVHELRRRRTRGAI